MAQVQTVNATSVAVGSLTTAGITTTSGNLLVACVGYVTFSGNALAFLTDNKGNTLAPVVASPSAISSPGAVAAMYVAQNIIGGSGHTFTAINSSYGALSIIVTEFSGRAVSNAVRASAAALSAAYATSYAGASVACISGDDFACFGVNNIGNAAQAFTNGAGLTIPTNGNINGTTTTIPALFQYAANVATGTQTGAYSGSQFDQYASLSIALEPVAAVSQTGLLLTLLGVG